MSTVPGDALPLEANVAMRWRSSSSIAANRGIVRRMLASIGGVSLARESQSYHTPARPRARAALARLSVRSGRRRARGLGSVDSHAPGPAQAGAVLQHALQARARRRRPRGRRARLPRWSGADAPG